MSRRMSDGEVSLGRAGAAGRRVQHRPSPLACHRRCLGRRPRDCAPFAPVLCVCGGVCVWGVCGGVAGGGRTAPTAVLEPAQACCPTPVSVSLAARP